MLILLFRKENIAERAELSKLLFFDDQIIDLTIIGVITTSF